MRQTLKTIVGGVVVLVGGLAAGLWLGQDRLLARFVQELNRYLRVPVQTSRLDVSVLDQFPRLSITLHDVVVSGSLPQDTAKLARARRLYCAFDAWDLLAGRYRIRAVMLADARVQVRLDAQGRPNYHILRFDTTAPPPDQAFRLQLEDIRLERVEVRYDDAGRRQHVAVRTPQLRAELAVTPAHVAITAEGNARVQTVRLGSDDYFQQKDITLTTRLLVDRPGQQLTIEPSEVRVGPAAYTVAGTVDYRRATQLNLRVAGRRTTVQSVVALLPPRLARRMGAYRSRGAVYFAGTVQGELSGRRNPAVALRFGCRDASFVYPATGQAVRHVFLTGSFGNGAARAARTATLRLQGVRGKLGGRPFAGNLQLDNLDNPFLRLDLQADVDVARAVQFFPVAAVRQARGDARLRLTFADNWRAFRARPATAPVQAAGELELHNVHLLLRDFRQPFTALTGTLALHRHDVAVRSLRGRVGGSDFVVNGTLRNGLGAVLLPGQPVRLEAAVASQVLDFNELLYLYQPAGAGGGPGNAAGRAGSGVRVPPTVALDLQATARRVRYRRLRGRDLRGTLRLHGQVFSSPGLTLTAAGGQASLRGTLDARQPTLLKATTVASCRQLRLDSLFYVFEDFGQRFITARHLRGTLTATAESDTYFDQHLSPLTDRLEAEVHATVRQGELLNFEPLQKLSFVASRATLRHLQFAELQNRLYVQSRTVYIPEMEVRSNVRAASLLRVTGTHTFDQQMDYHVSIPLLPGLLPRAAARATGPALRLSIQGTEQDFAVRYERGAGPAGPTTPEPPARTAVARTALPPAGPAPAAATAPAAPRKVFELKKPEKKQPAQPQTGEYFDF
ncbi:AsmA-like C-terminal region-containing protein [Hymenobacter weizhouensis]|uniref:AsmA-like C-terminal region-containing protein n=1 Tax=Hymenobacter sp. YIM 151500-1 TaxID=2987689 RepID=UPI00222611D4|nr:AsmA-like C-terminal region-containing protein [Hymenobacter sp. YIM 151500-1]UYZ62157.1 hypothetical protein OIS53_14230 [Hymenobacter sp. YIM 151500-1]